MRAANSLLATRILFFAALLVLGLVSCRSESEIGLNPGDQAPPFELPDLSGKLHQLSEFKGKVILLNFWASWCVPCVSEMPALERLYSRLKSKGFVVVAVGVDDDENALREFVRTYSLSFPVLVDKHRRLDRDYKVAGYPETFIIDAQGKLVMFLDPAENVPVIRIVGPREWDSPNAISRLTALLEQGQS